MDEYKENNENNENKTDEIKKEGDYNEWELITNNE